MRPRQVFGVLLLLLLAGTLAGCAGKKGVRWAESSAPAIRVNQVGYLPQGPKWATLRLDAQEPVEVRLVQGQKQLWKGHTIPRGSDAASGDPVHWIDFSTFTQAVDGVELKTATGTSFPFSIREDIYDQLPIDALKYFYHNRSGVPIGEPYITLYYSRPAGHLSDAHAPCWQDCQYALDVSGGWYDAGDHGKYVVNGGISAWTLLALYERLNYLSGTLNRWGDRTLNLPESGNGVPDLLDEARFEVEFLLKMQVPSGQPWEGMVHHKIHDNAWTALGMEPPPQAEQRGLHPPSTAATLNMAAVAAQAARIFKDYDAPFAQRCLLGARTAFAAALRHPDRFAPEMDKQGGGPYDDTYLDDEFFWAASELYITTAEEAYRDRMTKSVHFTTLPTVLKRARGGWDGDGVTGSMSWQSTAALGTISLAQVPNQLPVDEVKRLRASIILAAENALSRIEAEGYRLPMSLGPPKKYPWGSNSFVLNNMVILALASDFTGDDRFTHGVIQGMDYILGRNPMLQSYVTGYGTVPLEHPHHRFWAHSLNQAFPNAPPGAVSGGPNSSLQDPQTKKSGLSKSLPPQKCFVDHIEAWSVNEVTINWNAPLAFAAVFLNDYAHRAQQPAQAASE